MKNSIKEYLEKNKFTILLFLFIFGLIALQHSVIGMYHDDYGNASLTYIYHTDNVAGTNYTFKQLWEWASNIYMTWGGRIFYAIVFIIPLLKVGITAYMAVQTVVVFLIIYLIYKIIKSSCKNDKYTWLIPLIIFILYTCINIYYLRTGFFWASASVLYVWPLLPLLALLYHYHLLSVRIEKKESFKYIPNILYLIILCLLVVLSQEQFGAGLIPFFIMYMIVLNRKNIKKHLKIDIPCLLFSIIGYLVLFLAPGNWARMTTTDFFSKMSIIEKIKYNYPNVINSIFLEKNYIFMFLIMFLAIFMCVEIIKKYRNNKLIKYLVISSIITYIVQAIYTVVMINSYHESIIFNILSTISLVNIFIDSILYFNNTKDEQYYLYEILAICSIYCLLMSPVVGGRTSIPFMIILFVIITKLCVDCMCGDNKVFKVVLILIISVFGIYGSYNYVINYNGYRNNYVIMRLNDKILKKYDEDKNDKTITLYKVPCEIYGAAQIYEIDYIFDWVKEYYNIPSDVQVNWIDIYEGVK